MRFPCGFWVSHAIAESVNLRAMTGPVARLFISARYRPRPASLKPVHSLKYSLKHGVGDRVEPVAYTDLIKMEQL